MKFHRTLTASFLAALLLTSGVLRPESRGRPLLVEGQTYDVPFQAGEMLRYQVNWKPLFLIPAFKAGELTLRAEESHYHQLPVWQLTAQAMSDGLLSQVSGVEVRDRFESLIDRKDFRSYRILKQTRQNKRKRDLEAIFDYQNRRIRVRESDLLEDPPKVLRDESVSGIPGLLVDVLSVFYVARLLNYQPGEEYFLYFSDDGNTQRVPVRVLGYERVRTGLQPFEAVKLSTTGGFFRGGGEFRIWYSRDRHRIPVRFEADVRWGKVYGDLVHFEGGSVSRGLIRVN